MELLKRLANYYKNESQRAAVVSSGNTPEKISYKELWEYSDRLAEWIKQNIPNDKTPIPVFGHKNPFMLVCFLACVKAGHCYCPIDVSNPISRTEAIIKEVNPHLLIETEPLDAVANKKLSLCQIKEICSTASEITVSEADYVSGDDVFYIIFTSGSTGNPKGVQITASCLDNFLKWSVTLVKEAGAFPCFLNQAPFSFDLSVMDLYTSLYTGGCLWCLPKSIQLEIGLLFDSLEASNVDVWVSTPSFADVCLSDPRFSKSLLPRLKVFFFCGETLTNSTAKKLHSRFENVKVLNTYGPTESTVAITDVTVTPELAEKVSPLPVGVAKEGTWLYIMNDKGEILPEGEKGEIIIVGDTVSVGYFNQPELSSRMFFTMAVDGVTYRAYHTGDEGCLIDKMLYYSGRIDSQIKLHGYRIEIEDIENNILKLPEIIKAAVIPVYREGKVHSLTAVVVSSQKPESAFKASQQLRAQLKQYVPEYMVPKKFVFVDSFPMTNNGKIDRKTLGGILK